MLPITRSMYARCRGARGAPSNSSMPSSFTCLLNSQPKMRSRVAQQIARRAVPRKRLPHLLRGPFRGRMSGDAKMQNPPPLMRQHQEHGELLEPDGRYRKKVHRNHGLHVVLQEGSPGLGGRVVAAHQVLVGDSGGGWAPSSVRTSRRLNRIELSHSDQLLYCRLTDRRAALSNRGPRRSRRRRQPSLPHGTPITPSTVTCQSACAEAEDRVVSEKSIAL